MKSLVKSLYFVDIRFCGFLKKKTFSLEHNFVDFDFHGFVHEHINSVLCGHEFVEKGIYEINEVNSEDKMFY